MQINIMEPPGILWWLWTRDILKPIYNYHYHRVWHHIKLSNKLGNKTYDHIVSGTSCQGRHIVSFLDYSMSMVNKQQNFYTWQKWIEFNSNCQSKTHGMSHKFCQDWTQNSPATVAYEIFTFTMMRVRRSVMKQNLNAYNIIDNVSEEIV